MNNNIFRPINHDLQKDDHFGLVFDIKLTIDFLKSVVNHPAFFLAEYFQQIRDSVDISYIKYRSKTESDRFKNNYINLIEQVYKFEIKLQHNKFDFGIGMVLLQSIEYELTVYPIKMYNHRLELAFFLIMNEIFKGRSLLFCAEQLIIYEDAYIQKEFITIGPNCYLHEFSVKQFIAKSVFINYEPFSTNTVFLNSPLNHVHFDYRFKETSKNMFIGLDKVQSVRIRLSPEAAITNFTGLKDVKKLKLERENLCRRVVFNEIGHDAFYNFNFLERLQFSCISNNISYFLLPPSLVSLHIDSYSGCIIKDYTFKNLVNLTKLKLNGQYKSKEVELGKHGFDGLIKLKQLEISGYDCPDMLTKNDIIFPPTLTKLVLSSNRINKISEHAFSDLVNLTFLDLRYNYDLKKDIINLKGNKGLVILCYE